MTLDRLDIGSEAVISQVNGAGALHDRLLEMGLIPGVRVRLCRCAPLGDPLELFLRGYTLTLRKADAALIELADSAPCPQAVCASCPLKTGVCKK